MDKINRYVKPIIMRKHKFDIKAWIAYKKIIKKCKKLSPSFYDLWEIADFIEILRESYMYSNNDNFHLFTGTLPKGYNRNNARSMFYKEKDSFAIGFVLLNPMNSINIEIDRKGQTIKSEKEQISFIDGQYKFKDIYDQEKFLFITSCLMNGVCELITYYFKNKKF
jgi:hypothetical protein